MRLKTFAYRILAVFILAMVATAALAAPSTYKLRVDGLACPFCAYGLEKKLGAIPGVKKLETNIKDGTVTVTMKDGATLDEAVAEKAVKEAGFHLRKLEQVQPSRQNTPKERTK